MNIEQQRVVKVLERMIDMAKEDKDYAGMFSVSLQGELEDMMMDDAFGTEGQCDPRGDGRNGEFSMNYVEGVDDV